MRVFLTLNVVTDILSLTSKLISTSGRDTLIGRKSIGQHESILTGCERWQRRGGSGIRGVVRQDRFKVHELKSPVSPPQVRHVDNQLILLMLTWTL